MEDATSHLPSSARDDSLTKDVLESLAMKDSDRVEVPQLLDTGSSLPPNAISSGAARQDLPVGQTSSELFAKEAAVEVGTPAKLENLELTSKLQLSVRDMGMDDPISPYEILEGNGNGLLPEASVVLDQQSNIGLESDSNELLSGNEALPTEDMPSFSEWAKKQLEEQVKHGTVHHR